MRTRGHAAPEVERLAREFLRAPLTVQVNNAATLTANASIAQHFEVVTDHERHGRFMQLLRRVHGPEARDANGGGGSGGMGGGVSGGKVIVFCASKRGCETLRTELRRRGHAAESLHGDKSQQERDWVMQQFRTSEVSLLLATDVASRGLDVKGIRVVIK